MAVHPAVTDPYISRGTPEEIMITQGKNQNSIH